MLAAFLLSEHFLIYFDPELAFNARFSSRDPGWFILGFVEFAGLVALWLAFARFVGNRTRRPIMVFVHLSWLVPSALLLGLHFSAVFALGAPAARWDTFLMVVCMALSLYAAARTYLFIASRAKGTA